MSNIELDVITNDQDKVLVSFSYLATFLVQVSSLDKICLFDSEESTEPLACAKVGNPSGHWTDQSFKYKKGQVSLDISHQTLERERSYRLAYVSHREGSDIIITETTLTLNEDGILVNLPIESFDSEHESLPSPTIAGYTCISGVPSSVNTNSFDQCPPSSSQPNSSFIVVNEEDSHQTVEPEALFVIDSPDSIPPQESPTNSLATESSCSEPQNTETSEQLVSFHVEEDSFHVVPSIHEVPPATQERRSEDLTSVGESPKPKPRQRKTLEEPRKDDDFQAAKLSTNPAEMSVSVNLGGEGFISQKEAQKLKKLNKEQSQKLKKLTSIMEGMKHELEEVKTDETSNEDKQMLQGQIDHLLCKNAEVEETLEHTAAENQALKTENQGLKAALNEMDAKLEALKRKLKIDNQQSPKAGQQAEMEALKKKITQVTMERDSHFQRNGVLLNEVQDKEKENEVLRSENMVLQGKLQREEKRRQKREAESEQRKVKAREPVKVEPVKVQPSPPLQNGHLEPQGRPSHNRPAQSGPAEPRARPSQNRPAQNGPPVEPQAHNKPAHNGPSAQARPLDLPLAGGAKLKAAPPPQTANQQSKHYSRDSHPKRQHQAPQPTKTEESKRRSVPPTSKPRQQPAAIRPSQGIPQRQSDETRNISGQKVDDLASSLQGASTVVCPICQKVLHARDNEYSVLLHVEHCLRNT